MELMKKCVDKYHHYPEEMNPKYRWDNQFYNQVVDLIEVLTAFVRFGDECEIQLPPPERNAYLPDIILLRLTDNENDVGIIKPS
ncbi:MAG: hypothetical protein J6Z80_02675, partial [Clostridia bacterium]|nr:hypothetical protein [Clostridia bacterium]